MLVNYDGRQFICHCSYAEREKIKRAGFNWAPDQKKWVTLKVRVAARLREFASEAAKKEIEKALIAITPWSGPVHYPKHLSPHPFQLEAARFALSRRNAYIGLDPGLGKTIVAAMVRNTLKRKSVYVCPPFMVLNVEYEFNKWCPGARIATFNKNINRDVQVSDVLIVPDSQMHSDFALTILDEFLGDTENAALFGDEVHRFKSDTARRSKYMWKKYVPRFQRVFAMSGTPMPNSPIELFGVLDALAPECIDFETKFKYALKFCRAFEGPWGWDFSGASNLEELSERISPFLLRMKKEDVLKELPPKTEELVFVGDDMPRKLSAMEAAILKHMSPEDLMKGTFSSDGDIALPTYRRLLGEVKVKPALEFIRYLLEETEENLLVFAIHRDTMAALEMGLSDYAPYVITGDTPMNFRNNYVNAFQTDKKRRVFLGNVQACGTGFTLTKATRVIFVEFPWVPAEIDQAADRTHRIGQDNPVLVQFLVYKNSIDRHVMETIFKKREITKHV